MFSRHNDWQQPDACKISTVVMMHSERWLRCGVEVERQLVDNIIQLFGLLHFEPRVSSGKQPSALSHPTYKPSRATVNWLYYPRSLQVQHFHYLVVLVLLVSEMAFPQCRVNSLILRNHKLKSLVSRAPLRSASGFRVPIH